MQVGQRRCLVCSCEGTMALRTTALAQVLGSASAPTLHSQLCQAERGRVQAAAEAGGPLLIACAQEAAALRELLPEEAADTARFVDIRDRAGWSVEAAEAGPKIAALLAEAALDIDPAPSLTLRSEGRCLVIGRDEAALEAAGQLAGRLAVTLLVPPTADLLLPRLTSFPVLAGTTVGARGHLGAFAVTVQGLAAALPSSRDRLRFGVGRDGVLEADMILDLTGGTPLFPAHGKRDGYLRPDPRDPAAVQRALFEAADLVGEFEKPRYVAFDASLCAHSRSRRTGCTRCLDECPTGAITPNGDHVRIDPYVCAGCGACSAVCPTGAATYAAPAPNALLERLRTLLGTYFRAGGAAPVLLLHESRHGDELISAMARRGQGLPARVIPFAVTEIAQAGLETLAAAFAYGATSLVVLVPPKKRDEAPALERNVGYLDVVLSELGFGADRVRLVHEDDPDAVEAVLYGLPRQPSLPSGDFLPMGGKRTLMRLALDRLHDIAPTPVETVALPAGAPFGTVQLDVEGCTLCLACVGACPTGALLDNPDRPMLRFLEDACVQCGLCQNTCPEKVIRLEPRLSFAPEAKSPRTLKEEEPAECVRCGKAFGTRSSIERIVKKLGEKHWMFQTPEQVARIRMCDDCRVISQFEAKDNPFAAGAKPRPRTSEDYLRERETKPG